MAAVSERAPHFGPTPSRPPGFSPSRPSRVRGPRGLTGQRIVWLLFTRAAHVLMFGHYLPKWVRLTGRRSTGRQYRRRPTSDDHLPRHSPSRSVRLDCASTVLSPSVYVNGSSRFLKPRWTCRCMINRAGTSMAARRATSSRFGDTKPNGIYVRSVRPGHPGQRTGH
jgi:hypothetical protein